MTIGVPCRDLGCPSRTPSTTTMTSNGCPRDSSASRDRSGVGASRSSSFHAGITMLTPGNVPSDGVTTGSHSR